jgi:hypothetical protein
MRNEKIRGKWHEIGMRFFYLLCHTMKNIFFHMRGDSLPFSKRRTPFLENEPWL